MIEISDVSKTYDKGKRKARTVLDHASLTLPSNGLVFIVGESGIGKSTILNAIGGLLSYDGKILYDGKEEKIEKYRKKNISYIFQDFLLFDELSVRDNIKIALNIAGVYDEEEINRRVSSLLNAVGLKISSGRRTAALSLGQRQRVAIARALATSPKIILADEPTGNLDSKNSLKVMEILKALSKTRLVVCVTHNMNLVRLFADEAFRIEKAKFEPISSLDGAVDEAYQKENSVAIDSLVETEFASDDLLLKCYSDEKGDKREIKIVKRGNEILVIGDNLVLASPKDVKLVEKQEEKVEADKETPSFEIDEKAISFASREEKPNWKDNAFIQEILACAFPTRHEKRHFLKNVFHFVEAISPIVLFLLLNFGVLAVNEVNSLTGYDSSFEHQFSFLCKQKSNEKDSDFIKSRTITPEQAMRLLTEDSGVVGLPFSARHTIPFDYFDLSLSSYLVKDAYSVSNDRSGYVYVFSQEEISSIPYYSYLKDYKLGDDELLLSSNFLDSNIVNYPCYNGKTLQEALLGNPLKIKDLSYVESFAHPANQEYVLKDYFDFREGKKSNNYYMPYYAVVANDVSATQLKNLALNVNAYTFADTSLAAGMNLPDFSSYAFRNYEDIETDSNYELVSSGLTVDSSDVQEEIANLYKIPTLYCSKAAFDEIEKSSYSSIFVNKIVTEYVVNHQNEEEKALYFVKTDKVNDPLDRFFSALVYNRFTHNRITSLSEGFSTSEEPSYEYSKNGTIEANIVLPSALLAKFPSFDLKKNSLIAPLDANKFSGRSSASYRDAYGFRQDLNAVSTYEGDFNAPIYVSEATEKQLTYLEKASNIENQFHQNTSGNDYEYVYLHGSRLFTNDFAKTKAYFEAHLDEFGLEAIQVSTLFSLTIEQNNLIAMRSISIPVMIIALILMLFTALDAMATVNQDKNKIGIYRCLGKSRADLLKNDILKNLGKGLFTCVIPISLITIFLAIFYLYTLSFWIIPFFLAYYLISLLASEIPLLFVLAKDPINIMHSLQ